MAFGLPGEVVRSPGGCQAWVQKEAPCPGRSLLEAESRAFLAHGPQGRGRGACGPGALLPTRAERAPSLLLCPHCPLGHLPAPCRQAQQHLSERFWEWPGIRRETVGCGWCGGLWGQADPASSRPAPLLCALGPYGQLRPCVNV